MTEEIFQMEISVSQNVIDGLGHVNNVTYLQWVQDIAERHWTHKASAELRKKVAWVVLHHSITYKRPAFAGDRLVLQTRVENCNGVKSERRTEIFKKGNGQELVEANTLWCLIDLKSQRPKRITPEIEKIFS